MTDLSATREFIHDHLDEPDLVREVLGLDEDETEQLLSSARVAFNHGPYLRWLERDD